jgi:hypothetical protein
VKLKTKNKEIERDVNPCKMAEEPPTYGIPLKISDNLWPIIKEEKEFYLEGKKCKVLQEIDIGENTWFIFEILNNL